MCSKVTLKSRNPLAKLFSKQWASWFHQLNSLFRVPSLIGRSGRLLILLNSFIDLSYPYLVVTDTSMSVLRSNNNRNGPKKGGITTLLILECHLFKLEDRKDWQRECWRHPFFVGVWTVPPCPRWVCQWTLQFLLVGDYL